MPSLWDLLCVSRQHKYTTHAKSNKRHPQQSTWEDPPYYDPANAEYYIQPDVSLSRRADHTTPSQTAPSHYVNHPPSPPQSSKEDFGVWESPRGDPRLSPSWYDEVRSPQSGRDIALREGEGSDARPALLSKSQQDFQALPSSPGGGHLVSSGRQNMVERDPEPGKRRHVRDIFADLSTQPEDNRYRSLPTGATSVSTYTPYGDWDWGSGLEPSGPRRSSGSASRPEPQSPRYGQIPGSRQSSGLSHTTQSGQTSPFPQTAPPQQIPRHRQAGPAKQTSPGYPPALGSWQSSGLTQTSGSRPSPRAKPPESMHQYSPRTVSDTAISAALFGNRMDDFVHDPGWNRAIDRFAASPTSTSTATSAFPFENKTLPPPSTKPPSPRKTVSPKDSDGNVTFCCRCRTKLFPSQQPPKRRNPSR
ncbi:uncharacterized protein LOC143285806 [Babylonia areolata]|uniref:uncharacterized protein LOC143285806 n=1 Tax=Babylonia areolata TaxID=304850 RepID=UPI003FCFF636